MKISVNINYDTNRIPDETGVLDYIVTILFGLFVFISVICIILITWMKIKKNLDIYLKSYFFLVLMIIGSILHITATFFSNNYLNEFYVIKKFNCSIWDYWVTMYGFTFWFCFLIISIVNSVLKSLLTLSDIESRRTHDLFVSEYENMFTIDEEENEEDEEERKKEIQELEDEMSEKNKDSNRYNMIDLKKITFYDYWRSLYYIITCRWKYVDLKYKYYLIKTAIPFIMCFNTFWLCLFADIFKLTKYYPEFKSCYSATWYKVIVSVVVFIHLFVIWVLFLAIVKGKKLISEKCSEYKKILILMTFILSASIAMNFLGLLSFRFGRFVYMILLMTLYLVSYGILFGKSIYRFLRNDTSHENDMLERLNSSIIFPSSFKEMIESPSVYEEYIYEFKLYMKKKCDKLFYLKSDYGLGMLHYESLYDIDKRPFFEEYYNYQDISFDEHKIFMIFPKKLINLYEQIIYRKEIVRKNIDSYNIDIPYNNRLEIQYLNQAILSNYFDFDDCYGMFKSMNDNNISDVDDLYINCLPIIPFSQDWIIDMNDLCQNVNNVDSRCVDISFFIEIETMLVDIFQVLYFSQFLESSKVMKKKREDAKTYKTYIDILYGQSESNQLKNASKMDKKFNVLKYYSLDIDDDQEIYSSNVNSEIKKTVI